MDKHCLRFSLRPNTNVQQVPQSRNSKSTLRYSVAFSFSNNIFSFTPGKRTQCQLPPYFFRINLKDTSSLSSIDPFGIYLSPLSNFLRHLDIPSWLGEVFKFMVFRLLENIFAGQMKLNQDIFTHATLQTKVFSKFLSLPMGQEEITHFPRQHFFSIICFRPNRKMGEETMTSSYLQFCIKRKKKSLIE